MSENIENGFAWMSKNGEPAEKVLQSDFGAKLWAGYSQVDGPTATLAPGAAIPATALTPSAQGKV